MHEDPCRGPIGSRGEELRTRSGRTLYLIYKETETRCGPRPPGWVCRHTCCNDTTAPHGFVCAVHTEWSTQSQNLADRSPQSVAKVVRAALEVWAEKGTLTCPHCGARGKGPTMYRWHMDRCAQRVQKVEPTL